jgi:hypothetical protein
MKKSTRDTLIALVLVLSSIAVFAMFMALSAPSPSAGDPAGNATGNPSGNAGGPSTAAPVTKPAATPTVAPTPGLGEQYVGYWRAVNPQTGITIDLHIVRTGSAFAVVVAGHTISYALAEEKLMPSTSGDGPVFATVGSEVTMTSESATPGAAPLVIVMQSISPSAQDLDSDKNATIIEGIHTIQVAIQQWAIDHGNLYPVPGLVVSGGQLAGYVDDWPADPLTGQPMALGSGAGNYAYQQLQGGQGFTLTGYGVDGSSLVTVP